MSQSEAWLSCQDSVWWPAGTILLSNPVDIPLQGQHSDDMASTTLLQRKMPYTLQLATLRQGVCEPQQDEMASELPAEKPNCNATTEVSSTKALEDQFTNKSSEGTVTEECHNELPPLQSPKDETVVIEEEDNSMERQYHPRSNTSNPRNAYILYLKRFFAEYKAQHHCAPFNFGELAKIGAARWRKLPDELKHEFVEMATKEQQWFRSRKDLAYPVVPKRPPSAFKMFVNDERANVLEQHPEYRYRDMLKVVTNKWRSLDRDAQNIYRRDASLARQNYMIELVDYILRNLNDAEPLESQLQELARWTGRRQFPASVLCAVKVARSMKPSAGIQS